MKKIAVLVIIVLTIGHFYNVCGQKIMKLDNELKVSSSPMQASRKGISAVGKYEFGQYRIVSGKAGWVTTSSSQKFLSLETKSESKSKSSFVFVANNTDTINVNTSINTKVTETGWDDFLTVINQSTDNYLAIISPAGDTVVWKMALALISGADVKGNYHAEGLMTDGSTRILIREVRLLEDGKTPLFKAICGYEFILNDKAIAAVQTSIDTSLKRYVWLSPELDENIKSLIASASAALMVYTDYMLSQE